MEPTLPVFAIERHRLLTDGQGVTTLVGAYGCPLSCRYCLNPHAWNPATLRKCKQFTPHALYEKVKIDDLYFLATNGGVTFGGGESLLHADFIKAFREICGIRWRICVETSLQVPMENLETALSCVDDFIVDIKDLNPAIYRAYTGKSVDTVLENLALLSREKSSDNVRIRVPHIPGYNTDADVEYSCNTLRRLGFLNPDIFSYVLRDR